MNLTLQFGRALAIAAAAAVAATFAGYVILLEQQGPQPESLATALQGAPTWLLAGLAATMVAIVGSVPLRSGRVRRTVLLGAATLLVAIGILAMFSIGLALLVAGLLAGLAACVEDRADPGVPVSARRRAR